MYLFFKKIVKKIIPHKFIFRIEPFLRKIYSIFFWGRSCFCTVCESSFSRFIRLKNDELLCPRCGSLPRDRRLFDLLKKENMLQGNMLDFSPSRALYRKFINRKGIEYYPSDFANEFISKYQFDVTAIRLQDNFIDLIICYHILEHVTDDKKAMSELYRVLKPGGSMFLQTPFSEGELIENPAIKSETERIKFFGQKDHVRIYSIDGISDRLRNAGFKIKILDYNEQTFNNSGFCVKEIILQCKK